MTPGVVRIVIADDQALVRDGIAHRLEDEGGIEVVGRAHDAESCVQQTLEHRPHVVLMDMDMPGRSVFEATIEIAAMPEEVRVLFMTAHASDVLIAQALSVDAAGIISKDDVPERLVDAILGALNDRSYFSPSVEARLVFGADGPRVANPEHAAFDRLTKREHEVLGYVASGMSKKDMAHTMHLSVKTIENHTSALMSKLRIHNRVELTRFAIRHGVSRA